MGRLEKIVVCTVLFLVFAILGISLSTEPEQGPQASAGKSTPTAPDKPAERRLARERALAEQSGPSGSSAAGAPGPTASGSAAPGGVMSTSLAPRPGAGAQEAVSAVGANSAPAEAANAPASASLSAPASDSVRAPLTAQPAPEYLVSRAGLTPTASDEFMTYAWQAGDSFRALAQRFYGSPLHVKRLRDANEGRDEAQLVAGDRILVSVKPTAHGDRLARPSARDGKSSESSAAQVVSGTYTVASGDVLGAISQKVYGTSSKWRTIYDANRDVIGADPNSLKPGMVLRIPQ